MGIVPTKSAERLRRLTAHPVVIGRFAAHIRLVQTAKHGPFLWRLLFELWTPEKAAAMAEEANLATGSPFSGRHRKLLERRSWRRRRGPASPPRWTAALTIAVLLPLSLSFFIGIFWIILLDWIPSDLPSSICVLQKICCRHDPNPVYLIVMDGWDVRWGCEDGWDGELEDCSSPFGSESEFLPALRPPTKRRTRHPLSPRVSQIRRTLSLSLSRSLEILN